MSEFRNLVLRNAWLLRLMSDLGSSELPSCLGARKIDVKVENFLYLIYENWKFDLS